jgi:peptidoglycan/xylan/chitin deacetylase (PgdA/CDA1 family)
MNRIVISPKKIFFIILYFSGIVEFFYFINKGRLRVLTYHNVLSDSIFENKLHMGVSHSEKNFETQLKLIKKRFKTSIKNLNCECIITVDDGYQNNFSTIYPLIKKYDISCIFFVTKNLVSGKALWIDKILIWVSYVSNGTYRLMGNEITIETSNRNNALQDLYNIILANYSIKEQLIEELEENYSFQEIKIEEEIYNQRFTGLSKDQIIEMHSASYVCAHSVNHDILSKLTKEELTADFSRCYNSDLYNEKFYCYPFGNAKEVNEKVLSACKDSGFSHGFINYIPSKYEYSNHTISRLTLPNTNDKYVLNAYLSGLHNFLKTGMLLPKMKMY